MPASSYEELTTDSALEVWYPGISAVSLDTDLYDWPDESGNNRTAVVSGSGGQGFSMTRSPTAGYPTGLPVFNEDMTVLQSKDNFFRRAGAPNGFWAPCRTSGEMTLMIWVYPLLDEDQRVFWMESGGDADELTNPIHLMVESGSPANALKSGIQGQLYTGSAGQVPSSTWTHLALVIDSTGAGEAYVYVNGSLVHTFTGVTSLDTTDKGSAYTRGIGIGYQMSNGTGTGAGDASNNGWDGSLFDPMIFSRALTAEEVAIHMNQTAPSNDPLAAVRSSVRSSVGATIQ